MKRTQIEIDSYIELIQSSRISLGQKSSLFSIISDDESFVVTGRRSASNGQSKWNHRMQRPYVSTRSSCGRLRTIYGEQKKNTNRQWQLSLGTLIIDVHMPISCGTRVARKLVSFQVVLLLSITRRVKKFSRNREKLFKKCIKLRRKMVRFPYASGNFNYRVEKKFLKTSI